MSEQTIDYFFGDMVFPARKSAFDIGKVVSLIKEQCSKQISCTLFLSTVTGYFILNFQHSYKCLFDLKCHCNEKIVNSILIVKEQHSADKTQWDGFQFLDTSFRFRDI